MQKTDLCFPIHHKNQAEMIFPGVKYNGLSSIIPGISSRIKTKAKFAFAKGLSDVRYSTIMCSIQKLHFAGTFNGKRIASV